MRYIRQPLPSRLVIRRQTRSPFITIARAYGKTYGVLGVKLYGKQGLLSALRQPRPTWKEFKVCVCAYAWVECVRQWNQGTRDQRKQ